MFSSIRKLRPIIPALAIMILLPLSKGRSEDENPDSISSVRLESILIPLDEAYQNPDFDAFRDRLLAAIDQKDLEFLVHHLDDEIHVSLGGHKGIDDFLEYWKLRKAPEDSRFWAELAEAVILGGTFDNPERSSFTTPYLFTRFPNGFDPFFYDVIINRNVCLRAMPDSNSAVLDTLTYAIVKKSPEPWSRQDSWRKIETQSGVTGYVESRSIRSAIDYRANFTQKNDTWKITFFLHGD